MKAHMSKHDSRVAFLEREMLRLSIDLGNAESGYDFDRADAIGAHMDRIEAELDSLHVDGVYVWLPPAAEGESKEAVT